MKINIWYKSGNLSEIDTASYTDSSFFKTLSNNDPAANIATEFSVRFDKVFEGRGLFFDIIWNNAIKDQNTHRAEPLDLPGFEAGENEQPVEIEHANVQIARRVVLATAEEMADILEVSVNNQVIILRQGESFINMRLFTTKLKLLTDFAPDDTALCEKTQALYAHYSKHNPDWTDTQIAQEIGMSAQQLAELLEQYEAQETQEFEENEDKVSEFSAPALPEGLGELDETNNNNNNSTPDVITDTIPNTITDTIPNTISDVIFDTINDKKEQE